MEARMADLKPIEYPAHLLNHNLTEQELAPMSEQQRALAKDWNVLKRQIDWLVREAVEQHNVLVEHDNLLDTWKKWLWLSTLVAGGGGGGFYVIMKLMEKHP